MWLKVTSSKLCLYRFFALCCLGMSFSSVFPAAASTTTLEQASSLRKEMGSIAEKIVKDATEYIASKNQVDGVCILLGGVNSGKSTLLNFLAGRKLRVVEGALEEKEIVVENPINSSPLAEHAYKGTRIPTPYFAKDRRLLFYDCPGLEDLSGRDQLVNAYVFEKLFSIYSAIPIKVVFVFDPYSVKKRDSNFIPTIKNLAEMFLENMSDLKVSLSAVATKYRVSSEGVIQDDGKVRLKVKSGVADAIKDSVKIDDLSQEALELLEGFKAGAYPLAYFPAPDREGEYLNEQAREKCRKDIIDSVASVRYFPHIVKPLPCPSAEGEKVARSLLEHLSEDLENYIKGTVRDKFIQLCKGTLTAEKKAADVRSKFKTLKVAFEKLKSKYGSFDEGSNAIRNVVSAMHTEGGDKNFENYIIERLNMISFLQAFGTPATGFFAEWYAAFEDLKKMAVSLAASPIFTPKDKNVLEVSAIFLGSDEVMSECKKAMPKLLVVHVGNTFYCDADLKLSGVSCVIIAPIWVISENRTISLAGTKGENGKEQEDLDGIPGIAGSHGGHIFATCQKGKGVGLKNLRIDTSGGNGGDGTDGTDGTDATPQNEADGEFGSLIIPQKVTSDDLSGHSVNQRKQKYPGLAKRIVHYPSLASKNITAIEYKLSYREGKGTAGKNGTDGGKGGEGAAGGSAGKITFVGLTGAEMIAKGGAKGKNGQAGQGGKGSIGGNDRREEYLSELVIFYPKACKGRRFPDYTFTNLDPILQREITGPRAPNGSAGSTPTQLVKAKKNNDLPTEIDPQDFLTAYDKWVDEMKEEKIAVFIESRNMGEYDEVTPQAADSAPVEQEPKGKVKKKKKASERI